METVSGRGISSAGPRPTALTPCFVPLRPTAWNTRRRSSRRVAAVKAQADLSMADSLVSAAHGMLQSSNAAAGEHLMSQHIAFSDAHQQLLNIVYTLADAPASQAAAVEAVAKDDGWLAPISNGLDYLLHQIQIGLDQLHVPYSYGWAIIVLTVGTKVLTFPFTKVQVESALAVQKLKPTIDAIKRQYGDDKKAIQRETTALYEASGVNPAAGCLPTLATIPIFWGLYRTLSSVATAGLLTEGFYWIPSLSGPTSIAAQRAGTGTAWLFPLADGAPPVGWEDASKYLVLPVLLVVAQFASSAIISPPIKDDDQNAGFTKALFAFLPFMVGWFALNVPSGLSLYYFSNTIITSGIQIWLRKLGGAKAFDWQQEIGLNQARRTGEVADLEALYAFDWGDLEASTSGQLSDGAHAMAATSAASAEAAALNGNGAAAAVKKEDGSAAQPPSMRAKRKRRSLLEAQGTATIE